MIAPDRRACIDVQLPEGAALTQITHWVQPHEGVEWIATWPSGVGFRVARLHLIEDVTPHQVQAVCDALEQQGCTVSIEYAPVPQWVDK